MFEEILNKNILNTSSYSLFRHDIYIPEREKHKREF